MKNLKILPYKMNSLSSRTISRHFGCKRIYPNKKYIPKPEHIVLNWGFAGKVQVFNKANDNFKIINLPRAVENASDKIAALTLMKDNGVPCVDFYLDRESALESIREGNVIYCRTLTRAKEGKGIVLASNEDELVDSRLYTVLFKNDTEYRIHVFDGEVIDQVQKRKMSTDRANKLSVKDENRSDLIRNKMKGWSFTRKDVVIKDHVKQTAIDATKALGLDFAAVDIAYDSKTDECRVLELNTAPGMKRGTTTHLRYVKAISKYLGLDFSVEEYNKRYGSDAEVYLEPVEEPIEEVIEEDIADDAE